MAVVDGDMAHRFLSIILFGLTMQAFAQKPLVFTYVGGYRGNIVNCKAIDAKKLTHVLYAFADVYKNRAHLNYPKTDDLNLRQLSSLRKVNPDIKLMISVGGLGWSRNFSDMALTEQGAVSICRELCRTHYQVSVGWR